MADAAKPTTPPVAAPALRETEGMGFTEAAHTLAPYVVLMVVFVVAAMDKDLPDLAKTFATDLFGAMLLLINPTKQFIRRVRAKKEKPK